MVIGTGSSDVRELRGDLVCGLCVRTAAVVQGPHITRFVASLVRLRSEAHAGAVRRLRCPYCGGHLTLREVREVRIASVPGYGEGERVQAGGQASA